MPTHKSKADNDRLYRSNFDVLLHKDKNLISLKRNEEGKYSANDAKKVLEVTLKAAKQYKAEIDRWTYYMSAINKALPRDGQLSVDDLEAMKEADPNPQLVVGKFGQPRLNFATSKQANTITL